MTDKELFFKYNFIRTDNYSDSKEKLAKEIYNNSFKTNKPENDNRWLILLHGTYNCNANCIYCENHKLRETYNNAIISKELVQQIVQKLGDNIREVTWHGGESLLLDEDLLKTLVIEKNKYNFNFKISLQTNGILLTKEKKQFLDNLNIKWGSSFDGLYNTENRGIASTNAILNLIKEDNTIGTICVIIKNSIYNLIENYEYSKSLGLKSIQSCIVRENVIDATNPFLIKNNIAIEELLKYYKYWIFDTKNPIIDVYLSRWTEKLLHKTYLCEDIKCIGGWLIIDPLGNIATCGMSPKENNFININDIQNSEDLLMNNKYIETFNKQKILYLKNCSDCEYKTVCYGGCMGLNYEQNHEYKIINSRYCEFVKDFLDGIYNIIKDLDLSNLELYNPYFLNILNNNNYFSLSEIKNFERIFNNNNA